MVSVRYQNIEESGLRYFVFFFLIQLELGGVCEHTVHCELGTELFVDIWSVCALCVLCALCALCAYITCETSKEERTRVVGW